MNFEYPDFNLEALPSEERPLAVSVIRQMESLRSYVGRFESALSLYHHALTIERANPMRNAGNWMFIAGRDGAMTLYHFLCAMEGAKACIHRGQTIKSVVDRDQMRQTSKAFEQAFPSCTKLRHSVAHAAELVSSPENTKKNALHGFITLQDNFFGDQYVNSIMGIEVSFRLHESSAVALANIRNLFCQSFKPTPNLFSFRFE